MAKDGTYRSGRRVKADGKPIPVAEKIQNGKKVRLMLNDIPDFEYADVEVDNISDGAYLEGYAQKEPW